MLRGLIILIAWAGVMVSGVAQSPDSFDPGADNGVFSFAVQTDGKILMGGQFTSLGGQNRNHVARLYADGTVDDTFNPGADRSVYSLAVQPDGQILVGGNFTNLAGQFHNHLGRLNAGGAVDTSFNPQGGGYLEMVQSLTALANGKIVAGGSFTVLGDQACNAIGRLNSGGSLDTDFNAAASGGVYSVAMQADGAMVLGGYLSFLGVQSCANIGRVFSDGGVDSAFSASASSSVQAVAMQADGKILVGGGFTSLNGEPRANIGRLNADGSLDNDFSPGANSLIISIILQADGKILVGGYFTSLGGKPCARIGRLNPDGSLDTTFPSSANGSVSALAIQPDGSILVAGVFTSLCGQPRRYIGRLTNTSAPTESLTTSGSNLTWLRGGTAPEAWRTTLDFTADGTNWTGLGSGGRIAGGWQWSGVSLPTRCIVRLRGYSTGGQKNGSSWFVESVFGPDTPLQVLTDDGHFGLVTNRFGFNFLGPIGQSAVVEASPDLAMWQPLQTNLLGLSPQCFSDPAAAATPRRFYRLRIARLSGNNSTPSAFAPIRSWSN
jgi:uncharacterized delta-60 repeat protein